MDRYRKRAFIQVIILCATAFGCFFYFSNNYTSNLRSPSRPTPSGLSWLSEEETVYEKPAPDQGYLLVHEYGGQQGAGVESLVSLQVSWCCQAMGNVDSFPPHAVLDEVCTT